MSIATIADVRALTGVGTDLVSDSDLQILIDIVESTTERLMNTKFTVTERVDILDGSGMDRITVEKNPLLKVKEFKTGTTSIDVDDLDWYRESGRIALKLNSITLSPSGGVGLLLARNNHVKVRYLYGLLEATSTQTESDADAIAGTSIAVSVLDETGFAVDDWVEIAGTDGNKEAAKVTATAAGEITVDELKLTHASGSLVTKITVPDYIKRFLMVESGIAASINAIGATYTFNASYSLGDLSVTKGVPYTHWRETTQKLVEERNYLWSRITPRAAVIAI